MNHTDSFKPPHEVGDGSPDGKEIFGFITGLFYLFIMTLSSFWALVARKPGTLGTRAYWFDFLCGNTLLLFLRQSFPFSPCYELFTGTLILMPVLFLWHITRTFFRKEHVHTQCIGTPMLPGGEVVEFLVGIALGYLISTYPMAQPYGIYICASASALAIRSFMVKERDRQRTVQMEDALWEQNQMMNLYERRNG